MKKISIHNIKLLCFILFFLFTILPIIIKFILWVSFGIIYIITHYIIESIGTLFGLIGCFLYIADKNNNYYDIED